MRPLHILIVLLVVVIWGLNFVVAKQLVQYFAPFEVLSIRFAMVSLFMIPFYIKPPLPLKQLILITITFTVGHLGCMFGSMYVGLDASMAVVLQQMAIPMVLILSVLYLKEKIGWMSILGIIIAIIGTFILSGSDNGSSHPLGILLILLSAFFWALYSFQLKKYQNNTNPVAMIVWIALLSIPFTSTISLLIEDNQLHNFINADATKWMLIAYMAFMGSVISHSLWCYLVSRNPVGNVAPFILLVPVSGAIAAILLLNDEVTNELITGGILMLLGVGIVTFRKPTVSKISKT